MNITHKTDAYAIVTLEQIKFVCGTIRTEATLTSCEWAERKFNAYGIVRGQEFNQSFETREMAHYYMQSKIQCVKEEALELLKTVQRY